MKKCTKCDSELNVFTVSLSHPNTCRACYSAFKRSRNKQQEEALKMRARTIANARLKLGIILKEECRLCGCEDSEMHHGDYKKPKEISWLCRKCHTELHVLGRKAILAS
jgi:hypothetical protein